MYELQEYATRHKPEEVRRYAEEQQLLRDALAARPKHTGRFNRGLAALRCWLTALGSRLRARYVARYLPLDLPPLDFSPCDEQRGEV